MKQLRILAASLLGFAAVAVASPVLADTVDARCDVFPAGDDKATSSGLCTFSQRQGFVSIQLKNGQRIELKPNESTPNAFFDERGEPAKREMLEANRGQVYRLEKQSIFVFWDPAPYSKGAKGGSSAPGSGSATENPPEIVPLLLGIHQVKFDGGCRVNFNKAGKYFSKTSSCNAAQVGVAEDAIRRYFREQGISSVPSSSVPAKTSASEVGTPVATLGDLVGARAGQAENTIKQRGFRFLRADPSGDAVYGYWREATTNNCVIIRTTNGRYESIVYGTPSCN